MPRPLKSILVPALCAGTFLSLSGGLARAADITPTPPPANWWDTITVTGTVEAGVTMNPQNPAGRTEFRAFVHRQGQLALAQSDLVDRAAPARSESDRL